MKEEQVRTGNVNVNVSPTGRMWVDPNDLVRSSQFQEQLAAVKRLREKEEGVMHQREIAVGQAARKQDEAQALDELVALSEQAGLYEHDFPAKRGQVREPLTDEQIKDEASYFGFLGCVEQLIKFVRAIEAAHGITKEQT